MFLAMLQTNSKNLNPENTIGKSEVERCKRHFRRRHIAWGEVGLQVRKFCSQSGLGNRTSLGYMEFFYW